MKTASGFLAREMAARPDGQARPHDDAPNGVNPVRNQQADSENAQQWIAHLIPPLSKVQCEELPAHGVAFEGFHFGLGTCGLG